MPEGDSYFVLRYSEPKQLAEIWDPTTGNPYILQSVAYETRCCGIQISRGK